MGVIGLLQSKSAHVLSLWCPSAALPIERAPSQLNDRVAGLPGGRSPSAGMSCLGCIFRLDPGVNSFASSRRPANLAASRTRKVSTGSSPRSAPSRYDLLEARVRSSQNAALPNPGTTFTSPRRRDRGWLPEHTARPLLPSSRDAEKLARLGRTSPRVNSWGRMFLLSRICRM